MFYWGFHHFAGIGKTPRKRRKALLAGVSDTSLFVRHNQAGGGIDSAVGDSRDRGMGLVGPSEAIEDLIAGAGS